MGRICRISPQCFSCWKTKNLRYLNQNQVSIRGPVLAIWSCLTFDSCLFVLYAWDKDPNFKQKVLWFWDGTYNTSLRLFFQSWSLNWVKTSFKKGQTKLIWTEKKEVVLLLVINLARTGRQKYDSSVFCKFSARWNVS